MIAHVECITLPVLSMTPVQFWSILKDYSSLNTSAALYTGLEGPKAMTTAETVVKNGVAAPLKNPFNHFIISEMSRNLLALPLTSPPAQNAFPSHPLIIIRERVSSACHSCVN